MANSIYDITTSGPDPSAAGSVIAGEGQWGTDGIIVGASEVIVQSEDETNEPVVDRTQDQKGRTVSQLNYDMHTTLELQVIGTLPSSIVAGGVMTYKKNSADSSGRKFVINSVAYNGQFEDKKKYTISCERFQSFPTDS